MEPKGTSTLRVLSLPFRLWKRLHPFTWLVMLVAGAALVIIVVPGVFMGSWRESTRFYSHALTLSDQLPPPPTGTLPFMFAHGWPMPWCVRSVHVPVPTVSLPITTIPAPPPSSFPPPNWCRSLFWPFSASAWSLNWKNLFFDSLVAAIILFTLAGATEWWLRRRGGFFRFRIVDMLTLVTLVAISIGWYQYHFRLQQREVADLAKHVNSLDGETMRFGWEIVGPGMNSPELEYCGPDWLVRLVGNEQYLPGLWHFRKVNLTTLLPDLVRADVDQLVRWPYLNHVVIRPGCPLYAIENLTELSHLHSFTIEGLADAGNDTQAEQSRDPKSFLRVDQLDQLAVLPIDHLTLRDSKILTEDVTRLLSAQPTMRKLTLRETAISADELEALRAEFSQVSIAAEWFSAEASGFRPVPSEWHQSHIDQVRHERAEPKPPRVKFKYDDP